ncbi:ABC transporter ATP-binding protein [Parapusillimonas granuli]|uniref:ABC transporter ATP-binding protein n=1 Tax=Parapusillimonas granuli TaxID=380911 RepID=A0A853G3A3_9BURK|nr:ABC transporter ATP-binding protein [Parapusillimonas granuli]MBB5215913.1 branched-chain amino acid transport system ATP-binding protein [Parapusillimonas granuli]MEB2399396.1 ABC transporter ATP-binding protein [Alcaligenaceae bacterium]NYT50789.1 ABC transporter ATP-binding protein [Parapusillimonas granuli]
MSDALLELDGVTSGYMGDIDVLRNVSLSIRQGHISGLIGLNGAGKSTLFKTIYGFLKPKSGAIRLHGQDISGREPHTLIDDGLWYIPQESSLFPYLTVEENLLLPLQGRRARYGDVMAARLEDTLQKFPVLREKLRAQAGDLSGGQQKSLEFAKAYMVQPRVCLIDEPSIGLAPKVAMEVFQWIKAFAASGMGILLVDHNVRRVVSMSDHIYVLSLGEITASGAPEDFQGDLHAQVKEWLGITF